MAHIFDYSASGSAVNVDMDTLLVGNAGSGAFYGTLAMEEFWIDGATNWTSRWFTSQENQGIRTNFFTVNFETGNPTSLRAQGAIVSVDDFDAVPSVVDGFDNGRLVFFDLPFNNSDDGGAFIINGVDAVLFPSDPVTATYGTFNEAESANFADVAAARDTATAELETRFSTPMTDVDSIRVIRWSDGDVVTPDLDLVYTPDRNLFNQFHTLEDLVQQVRAPFDDVEYYNIGLGDYHNFRPASGFVPYAGTETEITLTAFDDQLSEAFHMGDVARTIWAGAGNDNITHGFTVYDNIYPTNPNLTPDAVSIHGEMGNDTIIAAVAPEGDLLIDGGTGDDQLTAVGYSDGFYDGVIDPNVTVRGGTGNDDISLGKRLNAYVEGGDGNDRVFRVDGSQTTFVAGAGDDSFFGGDGDETVYAGDGYDRIYLFSGEDVVYAGEGGGIYQTFSTDEAKIIFADAISGVTANLSVNGQFTGGYAVAASLTGFAHAVGTQFADHLSGSSAANLLQGAAGDDTLFGFGGADTLSGNTGDDEVRGNSGNDLVGGEDGNDRVFGGEGNDSVFGGSGDDVLLGGAGNDLLHGGTGFDTADYSSLTDNLVANINFGGAQNISSQGGTDRFVAIEGLLGGSGNDLLVGNALGNVINGGAGNDEIYGIGGGDILRGGNGNDQIEGSGGNDTMEGGAGSADVLNYFNSAGGVAVDLRLQGTAQSVGGSSGIDTFTGFEDLYGSNAGNDFLVGASDANRILGFGGNDTIFGFESADALIGMQGNDRIVGGLGADTLTGGNGADVFDFNQVAESDASGRDTIVDFGVGGADVIDLSTIDANATVAGNQAFNFVGSAAFSNAGDLRFATNGTNGFVLADIDGDSVADLNIMLLGVTSANAVDFIL